MEVGFAAHGRGHPFIELKWHSINFSIKMDIVKELTECLIKMGKHVRVSYF